MSSSRLNHFLQFARRHWQWLVQIGAVLLILSWLIIAWINLNQNLAQRNFGLGFGFLWKQAGFAIGESPIPFSPTDLYLTALAVGLLNTFKVVGVGLVLATVLGIFVGLGRLSSNWLVNKISAIFVQVLRNTPLLLQLLFWYSAFFLSLPLPSSPLNLYDLLFLSKQGMSIPWLRTTDSFSLGFPLIGLGGLGAIALHILLRRRQLQLGAQPTWFKFLPSAAIVISLAIALLVSGGKFPLTPDIPSFSQAQGVIGGLKLTAEYSTLVIGLSLYTASFIAEIVRAGIESVAKGQWEASRSLGLKPLQVMGYIIFPQALRVILPPLTSQYLNLAKNSSLAIAIGYPDIYAISSPTLNQTGRPIEVILILMAVYLTISLTLSLLMNLYSRSTSWEQAR